MNIQKYLRFPHTRNNKIENVIEKKNQIKKIQQP